MPSSILFAEPAAAEQMLSSSGADCRRVMQAASSDWLTPVADGLQTVLVFVQSGLEQVQGKP